MGSCCPKVHFLSDLVLGATQAMATEAEDCPNCVLFEKGVCRPAFEVCTDVAVECSGAVH